MLGKIDDDNLQKLIGSDQALYLMFLKYSALLFLQIVVMNAIISIAFFVIDPSPQHLKDNDDPTKDSSMNMVSSDSGNWKIITVFAHSLLIIIALTLLML